jgi:hypothetical protein
MWPRRLPQGKRHEALHAEGSLLSEDKACVRDLVSNEDAYLLKSGVEIFVGG